MCWLSKKQKTVEELVAELSAGMTDEQKSAYWYELSQNIFALLGKVDVPTFKTTAEHWVIVATRQYPSLVNIKLADSVFYTTSLDGLASILKRDWSNLVKYEAEISDCDDFAIRLHAHLTTYYRLTGIVPVWGPTGGGYHAFNLAVVKDGNNFIARLIEPQTDQIFMDTGPLGNYFPEKTAIELGILKPKI